MKYIYLLLVICFGFLACDTEVLITAEARHNVYMCNDCQHEWIREEGMAQCCPICGSTHIEIVE